MKEDKIEESLILEEINYNIYKNYYFLKNYDISVYKNWIDLKN